MFNIKTSTIDLNLFKGCRLLAIDGADVNIMLNENSDTHFKPNNKCEKGLN